VSPGGAKLPSLSAALAGVPAGVQRRGPWAGRRQLYVRFADEAETATIYTAAALRGEIVRLTARSRYHSVSIAGRDPLAEADFLVAAFDGADKTLPLMIEHDGQRPEALQRLLGFLDLVQISVDGCESEGVLERVTDSIGRAADKGVSHALAIVPADTASDAQLLRIVEKAHAASPDVAILLHPSVESARGPDRRWALLLERATAAHDDVRLLPADIKAVKA
jgi:hypothetical protein